MGTHTAIYVGLALYAVLMLGIALYWMIRVKEAEDYLMAGRGLPWWVLTGTITGTGIGTGVVIGGSGLAYRHGWAGSAYPIGLGVGTIIAGLLYARMRRYKFITLGEEIASYYGDNRIVVEFSNISLFVSQMCWLTVQIMGGAAVLAVITGVSPAYCIIGSGIITACISIPGGLKTVAYTDTAQAIILLIGIGCLAWSALSHSHGMAGLRESVPPAYSSFLGTASFGGWKIVNLMIVLLLAVIADPGRRLTMFSALTTGGAKASMVIGGAIIIVFSAFIGVIGMYAYRLNPSLADPDQAMPWLILNVLPSWLAAFVVVSIASATFSSASGNAIAVGTFFVRHIYPLVTGRFAQNPMVAARRALFAAFVVSTGAALMAGTIVGFVLKFLPVTMSGIAVIVLLGLFWRRGTWQGALAALIATPTVSIVLMSIPSKSEFWSNPVIPATVAGFVAHIVVSLLTPRETRSFDEVAESLAKARGEALDTRPEVEQPASPTPALVAAE